MKHKLAIVLLLTFLCGIVSGCYDRREVDDMAYVIALGLDKGKTNDLRLTLQIAKPVAIGGGEGGGGGGGGDEASTLISIDTPSIFSGLNMANSFLSKQVNLSHAKVIVFSKELAEEGLEKYINAIPRARELRPNMFVLIARNSAEGYIEEVKPALETNPAKYYDLNMRAFVYTGFTANTIFHNFYAQSKATYRQPVATLAGVNENKSTEDFDLGESTYEKKGRHKPLEGDFLAGNLPKISKVKAEVLGLAVFNGTRMVGELDGEETTFHLMTSGEYIQSFMTIPDPNEADSKVVLRIKESRKPVHKVDIVEGKPKIYTKIMLEADIQALQSGINYEDVENLKTLEMAYANHIKEGIERYLDRTAREFESDICGFGNHAKAKFLTWQQWMDLKWLSRYKDSTFEVDVDIKIRRPGLVIRTMPILSSEQGGTE